MERFPMVCDSCVHFDAGEWQCAAFPDEIPLDPIMAVTHYKPLPGQGNDIVWELAPGREALNAKEWFDKFHAATYGDA